MNESTSYFVYAISEMRDRCDYNKFPDVWKQKAYHLDWKLSKSDLDYDKYDYDTLYLFMAEQVPGGDKRFISCKSIDRKLYAEMFNRKSLVIQGMLQRMVESVDEPLPDDETANDIIDRTNNIFKNVDMWMQPGAVRPSHFSCVKIPSFFGQGWLLGQYIDKISESGTEPMYIPPRQGTSGVPAAGPEGIVGIDRTTNGVGWMPLGESLEEVLEVGYRGSWFTELWVFLYEEFKGQSIFVEFDCDNSEYYTAFELGPALRVSMHKDIAESEKGTVTEIHGHNLHLLAELFDRLASHGNGGHSFTWYINKNQKGTYQFRGSFDGDGGDYIFRISLRTERKTKSN